MNRHPAVRATVDYWSAKHYHDPAHVDFTGGGFNIERRWLLRKVYRDLRKHGYTPDKARGIILDACSFFCWGGSYVSHG